MKRWFALSAAVVAPVLMLRCGSPAQTSDAGAPGDAGGPPLADAGADAGGGPADAGQTDAGQSDAGLDAGGSPGDAGADAGVADAGGGDAGSPVTDAGPQLPNGTACTLPNDCDSGFCVPAQSGELCANVASCPLCQVIDPAGTACVAAVAGTDPKNECAADAGACLSDNCDGAGTCQVAAGTACGPGSCSGGTQNQPTCGAAGACQPVSTPCAPYVCGVASCLSNCASDMDCVLGDWCNKGACVPTAANGQPCLASDECTSGICTPSQNGMLCAAMACPQTCAVIGPTGTFCVAAAAGTNPKNECQANLAACQAAQCNGTTGASACALPNGTVCQAPSCNGNVLSKAFACFTGTCAQPAPPTQDCSPYQCSAGACTTSCQVDGDCASLALDYCTSANTCALKQSQGTVCQQPDQCSSNHCVNSFCCNTACSAPCTACNLIPRGTCANSPSGSPDARCTQTTSGCSGNSLVTQTPTGTCDGAGNCSTTTSSMSCSFGCFASACNTVAPTFAQDATATSSSAVVLDKEANLNPSIGIAPANAAVTVTAYVTPHNGAQSVTLTWTNDNFATTNPVSMTASGTSGANDLYTATIPGQPSGVTVRLYLDLLEWDGTTHVFNPGSFVNYTYVTQ